MNKITLLTLSLLATKGFASECNFPDKSQFAEPRIQLDEEVPENIARALETLAEEGLLVCNYKNECVINPNSDMEWFIERLKNEGVFSEKSAGGSKWCL